MEYNEAVNYVTLVLLAGGVALLLLFGGRRRAPVYLAIYLASLLLYRIFGMFDEWPDARLSYNSVLARMAMEFVFILSYAGFVAAALNTPLTRPLRGKARDRVVDGVVLAACLLPFLAPAWIVEDGTVLADGRHDWDLHRLPLQIGSVSLLIVSLWSLACATLAFRAAAPGSVARAQARAYLVAFAILDVTVLMDAIVVSLANFGVDVSAVRGTELSILLTANIVFLFLLQRALLRYRIFDFDLKLKWTIRRGTLAAIFVGTILVVAEVTQILVSNAFGIVAGILAAVGLFFAKRPLERAADRIANVALPGVDATPEYVARQKLAVYRAAVESAHETGGIDERERAALARLREKLGIPEPDALQAEADVLGA